MGKLAFIFTTFIVILVVACAPVTFPGLKTEMDENISLHQVLKDVDSFKGKTVIWGGKILSASNKKDGTYLEVLQMPLDRGGRPKDMDSSEGRFLVLYTDYLDVAIYRYGREITVAGEIEGIKTQPLGEIEYRYPLVKARKIKLWDERPESVRVYHEFPCYPCWYCDYGWRYHWCR